MNNSNLIPETPKETLEITERIKEREATLTRHIEALQYIKMLPQWSTLKTEILDGITKRLNIELLREAKSEHPDTLKLNRLSGELHWAERYSDLDVWEQSLRMELLGIKKRLHG